MADDRNGSDAKVFGEQWRPEIWRSHLLRRGNETVRNIWSDLFQSKKAPRVLFVTGAGFDPRLKVAPDQLVAAAYGTDAAVTALIVEFEGYRLADPLRGNTARNKEHLLKTFSAGKVLELPLSVGGRAAGSLRDATNATNTSLKTKAAFDDQVSLSEYDHVILDISSLPRIVYLTLLVHILATLVPEEKRRADRIGDAATFHVVVAEDPLLDAQIHSSELGHEVTYISGFGGTRHQAAHARRARVIMPVLGEGRIAQLKKVLGQQEGEVFDRGELEFCPVLPHPSRDPRRGDNLVASYGDLLFEQNDLDPRSFLYADESNPFEAYRQIRRAFNNYTDCYALLEGCRIEVVPLSSKLITIGAALACFEWHTTDYNAPWRIGIAYPEPSYYKVEVDADLEESQAELTLAVLTGDPYKSDGND